MTPLRSEPIIAWLRRRDEDLTPNAERPAFAWPVGDNCAAGAANLAFERPDQGGRRSGRLRVYGVVGGAEAR